MKQVQKGLFAVEEQMPCSPSQITIHKWALPATLEKTEREEAAARILSFSQQLNQWVGVSWHQLIEMMQADFEMNNAEEAARRHNRDEQNRVRQETRRYNFLSIVTLGIYSFFAKKPVAQLREVDNQTPFTVLFIFGPQMIVDAIHDLIDKGFLRHETEGEGENHIDVFFPTPALISRIMQKQGVATA